MFGQLSSMPRGARRPAPTEPSGGKPRCWYDRHRVCDDGSEHEGELQLITWNGPGNRGSARGWGGVDLAQAAALKRKFETQYGRDPGKFFKHYPSAFRWSCCGLLGDQRAGCDHHGTGGKSCTCDFCIMGQALPPHISPPAAQSRKGLTLSRGPDPRSFDPARAAVNHRMRGHLGLDDPSSGNFGAAPDLFGLPEFMARSDFGWPAGERDLLAQLRSFTELAAQVDAQVPPPRHGPSGPSGPSSSASTNGGGSGSAGSSSGSKGRGKSNSDSSTSSTSSSSSGGASRGGGSRGSSGASGSSGSTRRHPPPTSFDSDTLSAWFRDLNEGAMMHAITTAFGRSEEEARCMMALAGIMQQRWPMPAPPAAGGTSFGSSSRGSSGGGGGGRGSSTASGWGGGGSDAGPDMGAGSGSDGSQPSSRTHSFTSSLGGGSGAASAGSTPNGWSASGGAAAAGSTPGGLSGAGAAVRECQVCLWEEQRDGKPLKKCGGCKSVYFCSEACQRISWPQHKAACLVLRKQQAQ